MGVGGTLGFISEGGREYDLGIFTGFEGQYMYVLGEDEEEVFLDNDGEEFEN